jgi:tripartite-type tricarboxylate transporter receptor subunit TctC
MKRTNADSNHFGHPMRLILIAVFAVSSAHVAVTRAASGPRELVYAFPPAGPAEVVGTAPSDKVLRTLQRYAAPAFTDVLAMHVAHALQGEHDQPLNLARKPRQAGREALAKVSAAPPDGRTLLLASGAAAPAAATLRGGAPDSSELRSVAVVASMPYVLIAKAGSPYQTAANVVEDMRDASARALIGSPGERSVAHLAIERLRFLHRRAIEPVAYNGGVNAAHAVVSGQLSAALVPLPAVLPYVPGWRLRALALAESRPHPGIPLVPTNEEAGVGALEATGWFSVFAAAATPPSVIHELQMRLWRAAQPSDTRQVFYDLGVRLETSVATPSNQRGITGRTSRSISVDFPKVSALSSVG